MTKSEKDKRHRSVEVSLSGAEESRVRGKKERRIDLGMHGQVILDDGLVISSQKIRRALSKLYDNGIHVRIFLIMSKITCIYVSCLGTSSLVLS